MKYVIHKIFMSLTRQTFSVYFVCLMHCGCISGVHPSVQEMDLSEEEKTTFLVNHTVISRKVKLERGVAHKEIFISDKYVDVPATSSFGKEGEIANVDCIVSGIREVSEDLVVIYPVEFWKHVGERINKLELSELLTDHYTYIKTALALDYVVIAKHQKFDLATAAMEFLAEGLYTNKSKEVAEALTVDMKSGRVVDSIEVSYQSSLLIGHAVFVIPLVGVNYAIEAPCQLAGRHAAEVILRSQSEHRKPRVAVVAGYWTPFISAAPPPMPP